MAIRPILTLPLCLAIDYGRYLLILPVIIGWGVMMYGLGETMGRGIGDLIVTPIFILGYLAAVLDPRTTGAAYMESGDLVEWWNGIVLLSGLLLWLGAAVWHAVRRTEPKKRTGRERLRRVTRLAGYFTLFGTVATGAAILRGGSLALLLGMPFLFLFAALLGWWGVLVNLSADRLQESIRGPDPLAAVSQPAVLPVDARAEQQHGG